MEEKHIGLKSLGLDILGCNYPVPPSLIKNCCRGAKKYSLFDRLPIISIRSKIMSENLKLSIQIYATKT